MNRTCSLLALIGDQYHQINQPLERERLPEALEPLRVSPAEILDNASLEQGPDVIAVGPVGVIGADSLGMRQIEGTKVKGDAVAHAAGEQTGLLVEAVALVPGNLSGHVVGIEDESWAECRVPELDLQAFDAR